MHVPVDTGTVFPTFANCGVISPRGQREAGCRGRSTAAPNATPNALPSRSMIGPPESPCRTAPLIVFITRVTVVVR